MCDTCFHLTLQVERLSRLINLGGHERISVMEAEDYLAEVKQQLSEIKRSHEIPRVTRDSEPARQRGDTDTPE